MVRFVGRSEQLRRLELQYREAAESGAGLLLAVRGRRQVGKSTLYTEFVRRLRAAHLFFTAVKGASGARQMEAFQRDALASSPPVTDADVLFSTAPTSWSDVFGRLRVAAQAGPIVVVLDEFPWAVEADASLEGELQGAWDRHLQHLPILMILVGSDVAMMERVTEHDRPLYGRAREDEIRAFNPAEVAAALGPTAPPTAVFDAYLATGGYPKLVSEFVRAGDLGTYAAAGFDDENSNLVVVAQRSLDAEFPPEAQARRVLSAIGGQAVGHATFMSVVGRLPADDASPSTAGTAVTRALRILADQKGIVSIDVPAGQPANARLRRYRLADPYLRFWFRFVEPFLPHIARGRSDVARAAFSAGWPAWRGLAIEPEVHAALERLAPGVPVLSSSSEIGSWWNRDNSVEVDIAASRRQNVLAVGSIKWRERRRFTSAELAGLVQAREAIDRAADASLIVVCPAGTQTGVRADAVFDARDLLGAWSA